MAADVNLGAPTRDPRSDEIHNSGRVLAEGEPLVADDNPGVEARDRRYRTGYRDGFHDAREIETKDADDDDGGHEDAKPPSPVRRIVLYVLGALILAALLIGGVMYWLNARHFETTDDAFVDAHVANVAPRVAGQVTDIEFEDNQVVPAGQVLVKIDPRDFQQKVDQAQASLGSSRAQLAQARAQLDVQRANLNQSNAQVAVAEANSRQADQDLERYRNVDPRAVTRQDVDKSTATAHSSQAQLQAAQSAVGGVKAQIEAADAQVQAAEANVREAQVNLDNAELQLSYTTIVAPIAGRIAKRNVELGTYVAPGQALVAVVPPPSQMFVTANFKETQLTDMKPGDPVDIRIDAWSGVTLHGRVDSFQTGTGQAFSVLPAENATGNYVKVVQRLPVKIIFDDSRVNDFRLAPGLSVEPQVKVR